MNRQSLPVWVALSAVLALMLGGFAGYLTYEDGGSPEQALLAAGQAVGVCLLVAVAFLALFFRRG